MTRWAVVSALLLLTAILVPVAMLKAAPGPQPNPKSEIRNPKSGWGEPTNGLSLRLVADNVVWTNGEIPQLRFSLRNSGTTVVNWTDLEQGGGLLWDNIPFVSFYRYAASSGRDIAVHIIPVGARIDDVPFNFGNGRLTGILPPIPPGKHTIRLVIIAKWIYPHDNPDFNVVSNPVEIEIASSANPEVRSVNSNPFLAASAASNLQSAIGNPQWDWGEPVNGVSVRLSADKQVWEAGETPTLKASARNEGSAT